MPVFNLQGTHCQRPDEMTSWSPEKTLVKPHIITAQGPAGRNTAGLNRDVSPFAQLTSQLTSDEKLLEELAAGVRVGLYRLYGELGAGNCARVKMAVHQLTSDRVAVKVVDKAKLDHKQHEMLTEEVASMKQLHHPNIISLYEVVETPHHIHLVMEHAPSGDLRRRVTREGPLMENAARAVVSQLVSAVQHMHSKKLIHRDIKAENVFLFGRTVVKLGDLGFSRRVTSISQPLTQFCGSPPYAAPELLSAASYRGDSADLWALGVLMFFTVTGRLPFGGGDLTQLRGQILAGRYQWPAGVGSEQCRQLVGELLRRDPDLRPSAVAVGRCRWLCAHPPPAAARPLTLRSAPGGAQEKEARAKLRQLGVSDATLEEHRRRGLHSPVMGLYRLVLHGVYSGESEREVATGKDFWLRMDGSSKKCTII